MPSSIGYTGFLPELIVLIEVLIRNTNSRSLVRVSSSKHKALKKMIYSTSITTVV